MISCDLMLLKIVPLPAAYLAGSIGFSIILFKILGRDDPRNCLSGSPGTTNVYRQGQIYWATAPAPDTPHKPSRHSLTQEGHICCNFSLDRQGHFTYDFI